MKSSTSKTKAYYSNKVNVYGMPKNREKRIMQLIEENVKNKSILDVGCSEGYFGSKLKKKGAKVIGVDISKSAIKIAKQVLNEVRLVDLNDGKLPFQDRTFDIIVASEVIEHLIQPQKILNELARVVKKEGMVIITTPNFMYWGNRRKFLRGDFRYTKSGMFDESHIHFYTYKTLKEDLKKAGFAIILENHVLAGSGFLSSVRKRFPSIFAYQFLIKCAK